jgi:hypothetical protein
MLVKCICSILDRHRFYASSKNSGFALPIAIALGLVMIAFAGTSLLVAQNDRNNAVQRRASGASTLVSDGAIARALLELSKPNNDVLLVRNYDPIDSKTGKNYLGADATAKSGDESAATVDQWTGYDPSSTSCFQQLGRGAPSIALTGTIGVNETYSIRAYRYDKQNKIGTLLVEGNYKGQSSLVAVTLSIEPVLDDFPGVLLKNNGVHWDGKLALRNRSILGRIGNVYYAPLSSADPSLVGSSAPKDSTRLSYLNAIWSGPNDGSTSDTVEGKLFACQLKPTVPVVPQGTILGNVDTTLTLSGTSGKITHYQVQNINLFNNHTLTVDTTHGPVYLYISGGMISLKNTAKILNIRTDGQPPKVGDLRIMGLGDNAIRFADTTCIQNAFVYLPSDQMEIFTSGSGCPGGNNANFEGVAWVEELLFSKNAASNRDVHLYWTNVQNTTVTPAAKSGIAVPDDVSSLTDLIDYIDWPARYRYGSVKNWQRVN